MGEKAETGRVDGSRWDGADTQREEDAGVQQRNPPLTTQEEEEEEEEAVRTEIQQRNSELETLRNSGTQTSEKLTKTE